ncbi:hypothetical protein QOZ88_15110 [Blastococcus sp. BMG 814]|uniref:Mannosyl-glycoprotein endo-beta-N-acetylglucosaminidase n=1 Tax=Blastococcus carthaginiensis TaxID=3050034 RepID=A0ABT9IEF1_9ACTN|nr:hypothetical protein [Blastococcus carthaginiensis]MDP5183966.1 hypothetical protein [Blastococcus carthaginiensis]
MSSVRPATHGAAARPRTAARRRPGGRGPRRSSGRRSRGRTRRPSGATGVLRWWPALLVGAILVVAAWRTDVTVDIPTSGSCTLPGSSVTLSAEQVQNAATIAEVGRARGLPERAVVIALATAMQESTLRNLDHGDRDSLGLFQQRPSQGWGTPEQVQDPAYAAGQFYDRLVRVPAWETGELTLVADAVQRSAFPLAYGKWSAFAEELADALRPGAHAEPPCT